MTAILVKAIADLRRRRVQAVVIFVTVLLSIGTGTMAVTLMSQTRDPYQTAFQAQKGAHLQVTFNPKTDPKLLAATPAAIGASAFGGPYLATGLEFKYGDRKYYQNTFGRDTPGGAVEVLKIAGGRWPRANDEIVLTRSFAELNNVPRGAHLRVTSVPQTPMLTVVGEVIDIDEGSADLSSQHAWVLPAAIPALTTPDSRFYAMDYRFPGDPTSSQLAGYVDRLRASLPPDSISGSVNYLLIRSIFNITNQILTGVLSAFSVFALVATIAIVAVLVTGIVISAYREIGIMKALGFTPAGVTGVFTLQIVIPALAACLLGIPAGTLDAFARPLRAVLTVVTVLLGVATVVVAIGLPRSFLLINNSETGAGRYQVLVSRSDAYPDSEVMRILNAQEETERVVAVGGQNVVIPGISDPVNTRLLRGDSAQLGYMVIAGRWFTAPGEVLAPKGLLQEAHLKIGDQVTGSVNGEPLQLRVVGEVYDISNLGRSLFMDLATMAAVRPAIDPFTYYVTLKQGTDVNAYVGRVAAAQPDLIDVHASDTSIIAPVKIIDSVLLVLAAVLALIGVGGVFNTLLLNTRERVHDTATLKAVGMSPRQVIVMVAAAAGLLALVGGLLAMPLGLILHRTL